MEVKTYTENQITETIKVLCKKACCDLPSDVVRAIQTAYDKESNPTAKNILGQLVENQKLARNSMRPCCQDTGMTVVFCDIGNAAFVDGDIKKAINDGVRQAYTEYYFRKSVLSAIDRKNTGDNTPAIIHFDTHVGNDIHITVAPKGFGSENMSRIAMLKPSQGLQGVHDFIIDTVKTAGANPCPPTVIGIGIGGNFEECALLAKKQLMRPLDDVNEDKRLAAMEKELLCEINSLNIGPMGLGGDTSCLCVHIGELPTHLAGLPVAVNVQCHACRHAGCTLN